MRLRCVVWLLRPVASTACLVPASLVTASVSPLSLCSVPLHLTLCAGRAVLVQVGADEFCEATIGYKNADNGKMFQQLFDCPTFRVNTIADAYGAFALRCAHELG